MMNETYSSDLFADHSSTIDELRVGRSLMEGMRKALDRQLAHRCTDAQSFNSVAPEELVAEEGLDDRRNAG